MGIFNELFRKNKKAVEPEKTTSAGAEIPANDLVEASYFLGCCGECAKYRGRWFSVSGRDKRFPKKPDDYVCTCPGLTFYPVIFGISVPGCCPEDTDIIAYSNRPFVDDRSDEEKKTYEMSLKEIENEQFFAPYRERWLAIKEYDQQQYERVCELLPQLAPKSFSGYMRMKNGNTKNFQKLSAEAEKAGILLDYTDEIKAEISFLTPLHEQYLSVIAEINEFRYGIK